MVDDYKIWMERSISSLKIAQIGNIDGIFYLKKKNIQKQLLSH
jgi:hypothetical protein